MKSSISATSYYFCHFVVLIHKYMYTAQMIQFCVILLKQAQLKQQLLWVSWEMVVSEAMM